MGGGTPQPCVKLNRGFRGVDQGSSERCRRGKDRWLDHQPFSQGGYTPTFPLRHGQWSGSGSLFSPSTDLHTSMRARCVGVWPGGGVSQPSWFSQRPFSGPSFPGQNGPDGDPTPGCGHPGCRRLDPRGPRPQVRQVPCSAVQHTEINKFLFRVCWVANQAKYRWALIIQSLNFPRCFFLSFKPLQSANCEKLAEKNM